MKIRACRLIDTVYFCAVVITTMLSFSMVNAQGENNINIDFYFATIPADGTAYYTALNNIIPQTINPSLSLIQLVPSGSIMSAANTFVYPDGTGNILVTAAHVTNPSGFTLSQITWTFYSSGWSFTNVYDGYSFCPTLIGKNGSKIYSSGSSSGVVLTELWITPRSLEYDLNSGQNTGQGLASFNRSFGPWSGPGFKITQSGTIGSSKFSGNVYLSTIPPAFSVKSISQSPTNGFKLTFTNLTGLSFSILSTTNLALPKSSWKIQGYATEYPTNSGHYQFTDTTATNSVFKYYSIRSP